MRQLELNQQEQDMLLEILRNFLSNLRSEVFHTDNPEFREGLKVQEQLVKNILGKLEQS